MDKIKSLVYNFFMMGAMGALFLMRMVKPEKVRALEAKAALSKREPMVLGKGKTRPVRRIKYR